MAIKILSGKTGADFYRAIKSGGFFHPEVASRPLARKLAKVLMENRLPNISIKTDVEPLEFLKRLNDIAVQTGNFEVELHENVGLDGFHILNLVPRFLTSHKELLGQIIAASERTLHVKVEVRAAYWNPDPPTYEAYVEAAKGIFVPLLRSYNKSFNSRRRLNIQSKESLEPQLPPKANKYFKEFVVSANKNALHPYDWERFYRFIYICSPSSIEIVGDDVKRLLVSSGFSEKSSDRLADIFVHGRDLLRFVRH